LLAVGPGGEGGGGDTRTRGCEGVRTRGHEDTRGEGDTRTRGPGAGRGGALAPEATMMMGVCSEQSTFEKHTLSQRLRLPSAILPVSPPTHAPQLSMTACEYIVLGQY